MQDLANLKELHLNKFLGGKCPLPPILLTTHTHTPTLKQHATDESSLGFLLWAAITDTTAWVKSQVWSRLTLCVCEEGV